ncbi:hypothetical protein TWF281_000484 [Arthrobotrys megalospora]
MSSPRLQDLAPSRHILRTVFGDIQPTKIDVLVQTFETCTFSAHFAGESKYGTCDLLVRLDSASGQLEQASAMQQLAHLSIPRLVPKIFKVGCLTDVNGQKVEFSVMEFINGTVTLESIWQDLEDGQQAVLMGSIVDAMKEIQSLRLEDEAVKKVLSKTPFSHTMDGNSIPVADGPQLGYVENAADLFAALIKENNPKSPTSSIKTSPSGDGFILTSTYDGLSQLKIPSDILKDLQGRFVFCHNDLEPRNILVRSVPALDDAVKSYKLAAIIDWEMAGFYPFAYEYCLKDHVLGSSNLQFSWYTLFKEHTRLLLPAHESTETVIQAVDIIMSSRRKRLARNVGILVRERWIIREKLIKGSDLRDGWVRRADAGSID